MTGGETALLAAALVGALGATFGTYKVTNRSIEAQRTREREERLVDAYSDLILLVHCAMAKVERERPRVAFRGDADEYPDMGINEETRIKTRVQAIGSTAVRNKLELWRAMLSGFRMSVGILDEISGGAGRPRPESASVQEWAGLMSEMHERREALRDLSVELEESVRAELTGEVVPVEFPSVD